MQTPFFDAANANPPLCSSIQLGTLGSSKWRCRMPMPMLKSCTQLFIHPYAAIVYVCDMHIADCTSSLNPADNILMLSRRAASRTKSQMGLSPYLYLFNKLRYIVLCSPDAFLQPMQHHQKNFCTWYFACAKSTRKKHIHKIHILLYNHGVYIHT
jgi:hypothetical protein